MTNPIFHYPKNTEGVISWPLEQLMIGPQDKPGIGFDFFTYPLPKQKVVISPLGGGSTLTAHTVIPFAEAP